MRLSTSKSELQLALQKLSKATPTRSTLPILNCVLFQVEEDKTTLRSTDLEITIVIDLPASIEEAGSAAIPLHTLLNITNELPECRIGITVDSELNVELITDTGKYDLKAKPADEFPAPPEVDSRQVFSIEPERMISIIDKTLFAVSRDELKPSLTGVFFRVGDDSLVTVSTDGHRLVRYINHDYSAGEFKGDVIVPRKFLSLIRTLLSKDDTTQFWMGENHMTVSIGKDTIYTRVIDERFPDYESVIPTDNDKTFTTAVEGLLSAVRRVSIFSNKSTHQIALRLNADKKVITTEDPEKASKAQEDLMGDFAGEDIIIGYNATYLKDLLVHLSTENVSIQLKSPISAALFVPDTMDENADLTMLLMPIRLND